MLNDIVVVGGGIFGCGIAWRLAQQGLQVTLVERSAPGAEASSAAAGGIAPSAGRDGGAPLLSHWLTSHKRYPAFVNEVAHESGITPEYRAPGRLVVARGDDEDAALLASQEQQSSAGIVTELLTGDQARALEPALAPAVSSALLFPGHALVDNTQLTLALAMAAARRGVHILSGQSVTGVLGTTSTVTGVRLAGTLLPAGAVINAAGAWSGLLDSRFPLPVTPAKGQILALHSRPPQFHHLISVPGMTLVARSTGRIIAGGTVENAGFDKRTTAGSVQAILAMATAVMPALKYATFAEAWAGLRPLTPDFLPVVGKVTDGLFVASGHYMTGIMSAPATIDAVAGLVTQGKSPLPIDAFSPHRFEPRHAETEVSV